MIAPRRKTEVGQAAIEVTQPFDIWRRWLKPLPLEKAKTLTKLLSRCFQCVLLKWKKQVLDSRASGERSDQGSSIVRAIELISLVDPFVVINKPYCLIALTLTGKVLEFCITRSVLARGLDRLQAHQPIAIASRSIGPSPLLDPQMQADKYRK